MISGIRVLTRRSITRISRRLFSINNQIEDSQKEEMSSQKPSYFDQPVKQFNKLQLIPHFLLGATFIALGKLHLLIIPMISIPTHYYIVMGGISDGIDSFNLEKATDLSLDVKMQEIVLSHQATKNVLSKSAHLYAPYTFPNPVKENHIIESFDIKTRRFRMRCKFEDKTMKTAGDVLAEVLHIPGNEIYIEKLTVEVTAPLQQSLKLIELHQHNDEEMMIKLQNYHKKMIETVEQFTPDKMYEWMAEAQVYPKGKNK